MTNKIKIKSAHQYNEFGQKWMRGGCPNRDDKKICKCGDCCLAPQNVCIRNKTENTRIIKAIINEHHCWSLIKEDKLIDLVQSHNSFFMEILNNYPKKVHFDIDGFEPEKLNLKLVKEIINEHFPDAKMAISGSETESKISYHVVLPEYILKNDEDMQKLKYLVKLISQKYDFFDSAVYTKNRAMKCINQSKPKGALQKIIEDKNKKNHFICSFFTGNEKSINITIPEDLPQEEIKLKELPKLESKKLDKDFNNSDLNNTKKLLQMAPINKDFPHSYTWKCAIFAYSNGLTFEEFWNWAKQKDQSESRKKKWITFHWPNISNSDYTMKKVSFIQLLACFYPELLEVQNFNDIITRKFISSFDFESKKIKRIEQNHFRIEEKAVIFNIGMGGGKTTCTVDYLQQNNSNFIWLAPRQALVMNTFERFKNKNMNVLNYLDCGKSREIKIKNINKADKILLEAESLNKIQNCKKYDILVIDEIETVLNNWDSETHIKNKIDENFSNFKNLFMNVKKIILLDAFITKTTLNFLDNLKIDYLIYSSDYKPEKKVICENNRYEQTIDKISKDLDNKKKLYIFHAYKSSSNNHYSIEQLKSVILEKCQTKPKILVYHGDMNDNLKKSLYNVNDEWNKYDCILTTSSITVGVNYEGFDYDKIYLMVSGGVNNVRDIIQTSMRIRKTKDDKIEVFFFDRMKKEIFKYPEFYNTCNDEIYKKLIDDISYERQSNFIDSFYKFCHITNYDISNIKRYIYKKSEKFVNSLFSSKMLMSYDDIESISRQEAENLELNNIWATNATQYDKFQLNKYYFDMKFIYLDNDSKKFIWDNRMMNYFTDINHDLIKHIVKDNNIESLYDLNFKKIIISEETEKYINDNFKSTIKNNNQKIIKLINHIVSYPIIVNEKVGKSKKSKKTTYKFSNLAFEMNDIYNNYLINKEKIIKKKENDIWNLILDIDNKNEYDIIN